MSYDPVYFLAAGDYRHRQSCIRSDLPVRVSGHGVLLPNSVVRADGGKPGEMTTIGSGVAEELHYWRACAACVYRQFLSCIVKPFSK